MDHDPHLIFRADADEYRLWLAESDERLAEAGLDRAELEQGLADLLGVDYQSTTEDKETTEEAEED
jgi:hypothetical protein